MEIIRNSCQISLIINQVGWSPHQWCMNRTRLILIELAQHLIHTLICNNEKSISIDLVLMRQWQVRRLLTHWTLQSCNLVGCRVEWATWIVHNLYHQLLRQFKCRVARETCHPVVSPMLRNQLKCFSRLLEDLQASKIFNLSQGWSWRNLTLSNNNLFQW